VITVFLIFGAFAFGYVLNSLFEMGK